MAIQRRLAVLREASTFADVPRHRPARLHALRANRKGQYAVDVQRLLAYGVQTEPQTSSTRTGWSALTKSKVTSIVIREIVDYH